MLDVFVYDAADKNRKPAADAINSFASPELAVIYKNVTETLTQVSGIKIGRAHV